MLAIENVKSPSFCVVVIAIFTGAIFSAYQAFIITPLIIDSEVYEVAEAIESEDFKINPDSSGGVLEQFFQTLQSSQMLAAQDTTGLISEFKPEQTLIDSIYEFRAFSWA